MPRNLFTPRAELSSCFEFRIAKKVGQESRMLSRLPVRRSTKVRL